MKKKSHRRIVSEIIHRIFNGEKYTDFFEDHCMQYSNKGKKKKIESRRDLKQTLYSP